MPDSEKTPKDRIDDEAGKALAKVNKLLADPNAQDLNAELNEIKTSLITIKAIRTGRDRSGSPFDAVLQEYCINRKKCGSGPSGCDGPRACSPTGRMVSCVFIISPHAGLFQANRLLANFWRSLASGELPRTRSNISLSIRSGACVRRSLN